MAVTGKIALPESQCDLSSMVAASSLGPSMNLRHDRFGCQQGRSWISSSGTLRASLVLAMVKMSGAFIPLQPGMLPRDGPFHRGVLSGHGHLGVLKDAIPQMRPGRASERGPEMLLDRVDGMFPGVLKSVSTTLPVCRHTLSCASLWHFAGVYVLP